MTPLQKRKGTLHAMKEKKEEWRLIVVLKYLEAFNHLYPLTKANADNDINAVIEVKGLIGELNSAWALLPEILKENPIAKAS